MDGQKKKTKREKERDREREKEEERRGEERRKSTRGSARAVGMRPRLTDRHNESESAGSSGGVIRLPRVRRGR